MRRYDLAILGAGSAGLVAAIGAARLGARVVLVERERTGGDCLWTGCVPSKSLLATADLAHRMRAAGEVGLAPAQPEIDLGRVMARVRQVQASIAVHDAPERLRAEGVEVVHGEGRFEAPGRLVAGTRVLAYRRALVATGSRPVLPPLPGLEGMDPLTPALTTDTVWELDALPQRLVVLGGGATGCELAQAFARLGSAVTLVEMSDRLLSVEEPEAGALIIERLRAEGVQVYAGTRAEGLDGRALRLTGGHRVTFDRLLVATGRAPCSDGLGLEAIGARTAGSGAVQVDATLRTTARGVFAAGDVTGALPFTHVAGHQAAIVVPNALFHARRRFDPAAVPWVTFTAPEVARVGLTEAQARARHGAAVRVARHDYAQVDRAVTAASTHGFAKLVVGRRGRLLGATVAAPAAGEAIETRVRRPPLGCPRMRYVSSRERAPRREGHRTTLRLPSPVFEAATSLAKELGTTPNDAIVRLAEEGAAARARRDRIATLAAQRRSAVERSRGEDAAPFPSAEEARTAMLAGRREPE